jgi:ABC-type cobalamin/Fe3+-siderophores transport system ATPase subunit
MIQFIASPGGRAKLGQPEPVSGIDLEVGDIVTIVGPTGPGKTKLIHEVKVLTDARTPTGRHILIHGAPSPQEYRADPARHAIALITQHTPVPFELSAHGRSRSSMRAQIEGGRPHAGLCEYTRCCPNR